MGTLAVILQFLLLLVGMFMILIILLQRGRGGGLAGAFGGTGGQSAFGTKAGDVFTRITVVLATVWVLLAGFSGIAMRKASDSFGERFGDDKPGIQGTTEDSKGAGGDSSIPLSPSDLTVPTTTPATGTDAGSTTTPPASSEQTTPPPAEPQAPAAPKTEPASETPTPEKPATEAPAETPPADAPAKPAEGDTPAAPASETSPSPEAGSGN